MTRLPCTGGQGAAWADAPEGRRIQEPLMTGQENGRSSKGAVPQHQNKANRTGPGAVHGSAPSHHQAHPLSQRHVQGQARKSSQQSQAHHTHIQCTSCKDQAPSLGLKWGSWASGCGWVSHSDSGFSFCLLLLMEKKSIQP